MYASFPKSAQRSPHRSVKDTHRCGKNGISVAFPIRTAPKWLRNFRKLPDPMFMPAALNACPSSLTAFFHVLMTWSGTVSNTEAAS
eukprot:8632894-Alexandrium_andersonii.AAC.1